MNKNVTESLISAIKESIPEGTSLVSALMDILYIGKESAYRRLRGDVSFTFEEISRISHKLEISIDNIIGVSDRERAVFDLNLIDSENLMENYNLKLENYVKLYRKMQKFPDPTIRCALNTIPYSFYLSYENLSKFKLYRWLYQSIKSPSYLSYSDLIVPENIIQSQKTFITENRNVKKSIFILDRNIFKSFLYDVNYFYEIGLITQDEVKLLKQEMHELLNDLEAISISGTFKTGSDVLLYLSNIDLEASYSHYEYGTTEYSHLRVYSINGIDSQNPKVCKKQKEWIESLKRYSTLITNSGETQRIKFFREQRSLIESV